MDKTITLQVPDDLYEQINARAADEGVSVSDYLLRACTKLVEQNDIDALIERVRSRPQVDLRMSAADLIREGRDERDRELTDRWSSLTPRQ